MDRLWVGMVSKWLTVLMLLLCCSAGINAQISPGDLSAAHASLEGVTDCSKCHSGNRELAPDKCLSCHIRIKTQRESSTGLHSGPDYQDCQKCHVEHQGRDFALVYWKNGENAFDHNVTGFTLQGKHATLDCRNCHKKQYISGLAQGPDEKVDPSRTFLGLHSSCMSCHRDEHRGQEGDNCLKCHNQSAWKPAVGFDHATAKYALTGKHLTVDCVKCHALQKDRPQPDDPDYLKLNGLVFAQCSDCHKDVHKGKLGGNCSSCHTSEGWKIVNTAKFDHSRTRYPLVGQHLTVACNKCHTNRESKQELKYAACTDCHSDYHKGQFVKRPSKGACEECHTVNGFSPAQFLMSQHDQTDYPLRGAHRAVPCLACHKLTTSTSLASFNFVFKSTTCLVCHKDPHRGQVDKLVKSSGCESCHNVDAWNKIAYDHSKTEFPLEGRHVTILCSKCHTDSTASVKTAALQFTGVKKVCESCHKDPHRAQFAADAKTDCAHCHTAANWKAPKFDHLAARFKLDGAHRAVACGKCHPTVADAAGNYVKYRPIDISCASCHGTNVPERRG